MFHNEEVEITLTWRNQSTGAVEVAWKAQEGSSGDYHLPVGGESEAFILEMPQSKVEFTFGSLETLCLEWAESGSSGHFQLQDQATNWQPREGSATEDCFGLGTNKVRLGKLLTEGIVIVGILDIGGGGRG